MARKQVFNPASFGDTVNPFARAIRVGDILHVSGTSPIAHLKGPFLSRPVPADFAEQARLTFANLRTILAEAGATLDDVYKLTILMPDPKYLEPLRAVREAFFPDRAHVSTHLFVRLGRPDFLIV